MATATSVSLIASVAVAGPVDVVPVERLALLVSGSLRCGSEFHFLGVLSLFPSDWSLPESESG